VRDPDAVAAVDELEAAGCGVEVDAGVDVGFVLLSVGASEGATDGADCESRAGFAAALYDRTMLLYGLESLVYTLGKLSDSQNLYGRWRLAVDKP
jgi:hypothetical protein